VLAFVASTPAEEVSMSVLKAALPFLIVLLAGCDRGNQAEPTPAPAAAMPATSSMAAPHQEPATEAAPAPTTAAPSKALAPEKPAVQPVAMARPPRAPAQQPVATPTTATTAVDQHAHHDHPADHAHPAPMHTSESAGISDGDSDVVYTCPMHPDVKSKAPGRCPECGMDLVPKKP
jgi:hypothetical protein